MLRVAIVHYHLRTGGVTRVIEHTCAALQDTQVRIAVLTGEAPSVDGFADGKCAGLRMVDGLGYQQKGPDVRDQLLAKRLKEAATDALGAPPNLWHVHNHSLGKNLALPGALTHLAQQGQRLLLQLHDFAEDGRPSEYHGLLQHLGGGCASQLSRLLYPDAGHVHYATLNVRDHTYLQDAGLSDQRAHLLPNAVSRDEAGPDEESDASSDERMFLYPTRAIRRKNLGEFLLWAILSPLGDHFAVTRAPRNPIQRPVYDEWVKFAQELGLRVTFEYADSSGLSFGALIKSAHALMTTSIAEGFGLGFLEPWLSDRPLVGRNLPSVTGQFEEAGIDLSALYQRVDVPLEWVDRDVLRKRIENAMTQSLAAYGRSCTGQDVAAAFDSMVDDACVDFGRLDESLQMQVLERVHQSRQAAQFVKPSSLMPHDTVDTSSVERNRRIVEDVFGLGRYGQRLAQIYEQVAKSSVSEVSHLSGRRLLDQFLDPACFNLLRT